jgi:hypothetical protein
MNVWWEYGAALTSQSKFAVGYEVVGRRSVTRNAHGMLASVVTTDRVSDSGSGAAGAFMIHHSHLHRAK